MTTYFKKEPLELDHKSLITSACSKLFLLFSEYNFSNLYLFRKVHSYFLVHLDSYRAALLGSSYTKQQFLMPLFKPDNWTELFKVAQAVGATYLFPISETWGPFPEGATLTSNEDDSDYLFETEKIASYRGRHLDGKRNAVRGLLSRHSVVSSPFLEKDLSQALQIVDSWAKDMKGERSDAEECKEALHLASTLGLQGMIFEVDGKKHGILLGEPLTPDTFVIHFAKTSAPIRGLYAYMYQELAKGLPAHLKWLNWEQDLGLEALRHSKRSYHPATLLEKGRLTL